MLFFCDIHRSRQILLRHLSAVALRTMVVVALWPLQSTCSAENMGLQKCEIVPEVAPSRQLGCKEASKLGTSCTTLRLGSVSFALRSCGSLPKALVSPTVL